MLKRNAQLFEGLFAATDLLMISVAWTLSYWVRFHSGWLPIEKGIPPFSDYLRMLVFVWPIWAYVFRRVGLYKPMRGSRRVHEAWLLVKGNLFAVVFLLAFTYLFREKSVPFSRAVFVIFLGLGTVLTLFSRGLVRGLLREMRKKGYNQRYALIVGAGTLAKHVARKMITHPEYGVQLLGCLTSEDDQRKTFEQEAPLLSTKTNRLRELAQAQGSLGKLRVVGNYADLPRLLARGGVDQIIIALPLADHEKIGRIIESIGDAMVDVRIVPDFHQFIQLGSQVEEFDGLPVVSLASTPLAGFNRVLKRSLDLVFGTLFLVASLPMMALVAGIVRLTSQGPIFFFQERVGLDGRPFKIYKFRTMREDAEADGAKFAVDGDPRTTTVGRILRKLSLDELPQLVNVIAGDMSLVGPRPERPVFIEEFRQRVPKYMLRHKVQAGITGWAQVHGWRGNTSIEKRIEYDLYYIEHWSLALDLKIIGLTLLNSFRDRNAY